ncbi:MAG: hypothetical protein ACI4KF_04575 [Huintestinicola sp.]
MKRIILLIAAAAVCTAAMTACSDSKENQPEMQTAAVNNYIPQPDDTTVTGEVISITGNEVTLALGELAEQSKDKPEGEDPGKSDKSDTEGERPQKPDDGDMPDFGGDMPQMPSDGDMPQMPADGNMPDFGGGSSGKGNGGRGKHQSSIEKTGVEASYILPAGMPIDGLSGRSTDYSGVSAGMVLTLTINSDGIVCAASAE